MYIMSLAAGIGGWLQVLIFGYPSLRIQEDWLSVDNPTLPEGATGLTLRALRYKACAVTLYALFPI